MKMTNAFELRRDYLGLQEMKLRKWSRSWHGRKTQILEEKKKKKKKTRGNRFSQQQILDAVDMGIFKWKAEEMKKKEKVKILGKEKTSKVVAKCFCEKMRGQEQKTNQNFFGNEKSKFQVFAGFSYPGGFF